MIATELYTPHPLKVQDADQLPLLDAIDFDGIHHSLYAASELSSEEYSEATIAAAEHVTAAVRKALWIPRPRDVFLYSEYFDDKEILPPVPREFLATKQLTDCIGYALVTSECLDVAGIHHWIGYANTHATILLPMANTKIQLVDPLAPQLNQDITSSAYGLSCERIKDDIAVNGKAVALVNTARLSMGANTDYMKALADSPWLVFANKYSALNGIPPAHKLRVVMSIYESGEGKRILTEYKEYTEALESGNYLTAAACIKAMGGNYPNVDARNAHKSIKYLLLNLCTDGHTAIATEVVEEYFNSFRLSKDTRVTQAKADCLRIIADTSKDPQSAVRALELYQQVARSPKAFTAAVTGKLAVTQKLCANLGIHNA